MTAVKKACALINKYVPWKTIQNTDQMEPDYRYLKTNFPHLNVNQTAAALSFRYSMGNYLFHKANWPEILKKYKFHKNDLKHMLRYNYLYVTGKNTKFSELTDLRKAELKLFFERFFYG